MTAPRDRYQGSLLGLAVGDALGTTVEFKARGTFPPVTDIVGGGPFNLQPGEWTDDTSMALCLAESLLECNGMNLTDQVDRYVAWWKQGENSVTGACFDIGNTVRDALARYQASGNPASGSTDPQSAGNGSIMRLAPVPLYFASDPAKAARAAGESSLTTHGATEAVDACRLLATILSGFLNGFSKHEVLSSRIHGFRALEDPKLSPKVASIAEGDYMSLSEASVRGTGYVVESLRAALWAFWHSESFEEGALLAVNLGDDADTTGAVYGQIAGAHYGFAGIPTRWLEKVAWREHITNLADQIFERSNEYRKTQQAPEPRTSA